MHVLFNDGIAVIIDYDVCFDAVDDRCVQKARANR
jgi:hypothetical protein